MDSSVLELYQGVLSQLNLGQKVAGAAVVKSLTDALKKDDSIASLGMAFNLAANLGKTEGSAIFVRTHHMFSRILNFLFLIVFSTKKKITVILGFYNLETNHQNLRLTNGRFATISRQFSAIYLNVFHKTESF